MLMDEIHFRFSLCGKEIHVPRLFFSFSTHTKTEESPHECLIASAWTANEYENREKKKKKKKKWKIILVT